MEIKEYENIIEGILFAYGDIVPAKKLCEILSIDDKTLKKIMTDLCTRLVDQGRGIIIREIHNGYQMCTNSEYFDYVRKAFEDNDNTTLSQAAYETLSIIAYNKTATRAKIESIRGVSSGSTISTLIDKDLIEEAGRLDAPGRPVIYRPTTEFLRAFGFRNLDDLLPLETLSEEAVNQENRK